MLSSENASAPRKFLESSRSSPGRKYVSSYLPAKIHAALGNKEQAFAALDRAFQERSDWLAFVNVDPCLDPLRGDPRFQRLRRRLGL